MNKSAEGNIILRVLADLCEQLGIKSNAVDMQLLNEALERGHSWALPYLVGSPETDTAVAEETLDILRMWAHIEGKWRQLSSEDRHLITTSVPNWERRVKFVGFAGNDEAKHLSVALFLINHLGRFPCFKDRDLNSHCPYLDMLHRPMLRTYRRVCPDGMSVQQLIEVLSASGRDNHEQAA